MNIIFYFLFTIIGILLGSFFTLATYRLPKKQDILYTRSYCPNCNHKLGFLDLIPVFSYIFLGGKCRYCKNKIKPRYILIELISGIIYFLLILSLKIDFLNSSITNYIFITIVTFLYSISFIITSISLENNKIPNGLIILFYLVMPITIVYACMFVSRNIYTYTIYILFGIITQVAILKSIMR